MAGVSGPMAWSSSCDVVFKFPRDWRSRTHQWHRPQSSFCWQTTGVWWRFNCCFVWGQRSLRFGFEANAWEYQGAGEVIDSTMSWFNVLTKHSLWCLWFYGSMDVSTEHGLISWFWSIRYWTNTKHKISIPDILHSVNKHHRDSEANSLNELRPAWPNCGVQHGVACAWRRRCTVERKLKCSNVNMWRPDFGESLRSFHSKRLSCNLLQHCARISYYRKTSKGYFLCGSTWYPIWVNEDACFEACKDLRRLLDIDPNIQDREWMIIQLCHGCSWSSKTTQLFCFILLFDTVSFNRVQLFYISMHFLPSIRIWHVI